MILLNESNWKCNKISVMNDLVVKKLVEKIKNKFCHRKYFLYISWNFLEIFLKRQNLNNLKKFANKFVKKNKSNIKMKKKILILFLTLIYWQISIEKYFSKNCWYLFRRRYLKMLKKDWFSKRIHPNGWFWTSTLRSNSVIIHH